MRLDDAYANAAHIPGGDDYPEIWAGAARYFRERCARADALRFDLEYGKRPRERFDLFVPQGEHRGLFVFVHGGYWRISDKSDWSHLAEGLYSQGWAVAIPSYTLTPEASLPQITEDVSRAITVASELIDGPILLAGHSAGGHLVARMLCDGVLPAAVASRLQHVMPISPLADLRPLIETSMNEDFKLDMATAEAESPALLPQAVSCPVSIWVGGDERPAFIWQAEALATAWKAHLTLDNGKHHFDVIEGLEHGDSPMVRKLLGA